MVRKCGIFCFQCCFVSLSRLYSLAGLQEVLPHIFCSPWLSTSCPVGRVKCSRSGASSCEQHTLDKRVLTMGYGIYCTYTKKYMSLRGLFFPKTIKNSAHLYGVGKYVVFARSFFIFIMLSTPVLPALTCPVSPLPTSCLLHSTGQQRPVYSCWRLMWEAAIMAIPGFSNYELLSVFVVVTSWLADSQQVPWLAEAAQISLHSLNAVAHPEGKGATAKSVRS